MSAISICYATVECWHKEPPPPTEPWDVDELRWLRESMQDCIAAFNQLCRTVLRLFVNTQLPCRVIRQPCWSSRRWRSLT